MISFSPRVPVFRGSLLDAERDPRPRRNELHRGDEDARGQADARARSRGSARSGQRGQDKLQSNPRESARGQLRFVARPQEERSGARAWSKRDVDLLPTRPCGKCWRTVKLSSL